MVYEWNAGKATLNLRKHGVSFERMSVFPLKFGAALRTIVYPSGDPSGRFGLLGIGVERGEKAGQGTIPVNPPELLLGNQ